MSRILALVLAFASSAAWAADRPDRKVLRREDVAPERQAALDEAVLATRAEAIVKLKELLRSGVGEGEVRAEMIMRLAELYVEEGRDLHRREMERYIAAVDTCINTPGCVTDTIAPDHSASLADFDRAAKLYRKLGAEAPGFARADEATFFLAQALLARADAVQDEGARDEAARELTRLVRTWPQSTLSTDAFLLLGEHHFDRGEVFKALPAYQRAAADPTFAQRDFARYKLAWCQYNVGEYGAAFATMREVILAPATGQRAVTLREEALKDLVRIAADADLVDEAGEVFVRIGREDLRRSMLAGMVDTLLQQGKWDAAGVLTRRVLTERPDAPDAPQLHARLVEVAKKKGDTRGQVAAVQELRTRYSPTSGWARANASDADALKRADELVQDTLRRTAVELHTARRAKTSDLELAEGLYAAFLADHPTSPHAYELRYAHAEVLYKLQRHAAAYDEYMAVVAQDPAGAHSRFCAESAIFAARAVAEPLRRAQGAAPTPGLLPAEERWLAALDQYVRLYPDDSVKVQAMYYQAGYLHYEASDYRKASERFRTVIAMNPGTRDAQQAAELILDGLTLAADWPTLRATALEFSTQAGLGSAEFRAEARGVAASATLQVVETELLRTGDKLAAIAALAAFDAEFPDSPKAPLALNNRAVYAEQLGLFEEVVAAREALVARYPRSTWAQASAAPLGFAYESLARFEEAARWYETLADSDQPAAADALYSAAVFRAALGQPELALADYERLAKRWPDRPDAVGVRVEAARLLEGRGDLAAAQRAWMLLVAQGTPDERMYARLRYGRLLAGTGRAAEAPAWWRESLAQFETFRALGTVGPVARDAAAEMAFALVEPEFAAATALRMDGPGSSRMTARQAEATLQAQFADKIKRMQQLDRTYTHVVELGSTPWAIESLVRLGRASEDLSAAILASWIPTSLTPDQQELYRMRLEDLAWAPRQRAVEFYAAAADRAAGFTFRSDATVFASARLAELRPEGGPLPVERLPAPAFLASAATVRGAERE